VVGEALAPLDVRDGDAVVLVTGRAPEPGDLVAVREADGVLALWKAWPGAGSVRLSTGARSETRPAGAVAVEGVVVAVRRRLTAPAAPRTRVTVSGGPGDPARAPPAG
jgi:SOS-response transcriptional repressor LexA